jgi:hypothetical protein
MQSSEAHEQVVERELNNLWARINWSINVIKLTGLSKMEYGTRVVALIY